MSDRVKALPKAELHVHLDGSLRPDTMLDLAAGRGVAMPADTATALRSHMIVTDATDLEGYLERFSITLSVMQDEEAIERIAYELAVDHAAEGVRYVEARFCPLLNTEAGLSSPDVLEAALGGLRRAEAEHDVRTGVIVCTLRTLDPARSIELAELAISYRRRGVCGFDIAGAEQGYPVREHQEALERAARGGVPITIHAGEGFGPESIRQALDLGHARRIGHGTRLREDDALLERVRQERIVLETCLTSNVQTGVVASLADHPALEYHRAGVPISLATDNRLLSGVSLTDEYLNAHEALGFSWSELVEVARLGFEHAFVDEDVRLEMLRAFDAAASAL
ncbi:MAG: adenosine deaminase [Gemmatimonadota bacterium]|nr:adenosine deaminase [Gemmatimonadota bacterium]